MIAAGDRSPGGAPIRPDRAHTATAALITTLHTHPDTARAITYADVVETNLKAGA